MPPDDFEALAHRLVRLAFPTALRTANPDAGADMLLPRAGALGWTRAWQARRYSTGTVAWKRCEEALDAAVAAYAIERYTFVFAHDLSHTAVRAFDKRLTARHHGVTVDYWGVSELLARLDETREGRRVARSFFGPPQDEMDQQWREAVALGGELRNADDVLGRLRAMGSWLERRDAYAYETHTWETDQPAWRITPGTVMSQRDVDENGTRRIDARLRDAGRDDIRPPEIRIDFTPDEAGQRAMQALAHADADQSSARLTEGFTVTFEHLPELWADDEGVVQTPDELHLDPIEPPGKPRRFVLKIQTGEDPVVLDATFEPCDLDDWRTAWRGHVGGLQITFAVRQPSAERAEGYLHFAYKLLDGASARTEHEAVNALLALQRLGTVTVADPRFPEADIRFSLRGGERDEQLHALAIILDAVVTIEDYTAERLPLPPTIDREQGNLIVQTAHLVRTEAFDGQIDDEYVMPATDELLVGLNAGAPFMVQAEKGIELFGRTVWLGFLEYVIRDYDVVTDEAPPGRVLLRPRDADVLHVSGRLRPGKLTDVGVPSGLLSAPVETSRRDEPTGYELGGCAAAGWATSRARMDPDGCDHHDQQQACARQSSEDTIQCAAGARQTLPPHLNSRLRRLQQLRVRDRRRGGRVRRDIPTGPRGRRRPAHRTPARAFKQIHRP